MKNKLLIELYNKYHNELFLYLFSLCKDRTLAEDLLQETFLKAILSLSDDHVNMRAWLYLVARNMYFNYSKKEKKSIPLDSIDNTMVNAYASEVLESIISDERKRLLYKALQYLSKNKREILLLQYFSGLSQKEISSLLRITPENVRISAYRAKKELKKYLEENGYDIS